VQVYDIQLTNDWWCRTQEAWKQLLDAYGIWEQKDKQLLDFNILDK
jgi:hypothetical protein